MCVCVCVERGCVCGEGVVCVEGVCVVRVCVCGDGVVCVCVCVCVWRGGGVC